MTRLFVEACASGDIRGLLSLLSEDVGEKGCATTDQGGKDEGAGDNELGSVAATSRGDGGGSGTKPPGKGSANAPQGHARRPDLRVGLGVEEGSRDSAKARENPEEHEVGSESMTQLSRFSTGEALTVVGVPHTAVGLAKYRRTLREMARDGVVGSVNGDHERGEAFWFLVCGASEC